MIGVEPTLPKKTDPKSVAAAITPLGLKWWRIREFNPRLRSASAAF